MKPLLSITRLLLLTGIIAAGTAVAEKRMVSVVVPPVNQPETGQYYPGKFIWHDLFTDKLEDSIDFYTGLFGWEFRKFGPGTRAYYYITNNGMGVGGLSQLKTADGTENQWVSYISVENVESVHSYITQHGGKELVSPRVFHQIGDVAIFIDPEGAAFGVINSLSGDQREVLPQEGQWLWADLFAINPKVQTEFYSGIASYAVAENSATAIPEDYFLLSNNVPRGGVLPLPAEDILPNWLPYVRVKDINESVMKVAQLGGEVLLQPSMQIFNGRLAIITDPGGAALGIIEIRQQQ